MSPSRRAVSVGWQFNTYDLSVPGEMTPRSSTEIYGALSAAIVGHRAYTFGFNEGLQAWDIRNLDAPRTLGRNSASTLGARHAVAMGSTLLLPTATDLPRVQVALRSPADLDQLVACGRARRCDADAALSCSVLRLPHDRTLDPQVRSSRAASRWQRATARG